MTDDDAYVFGPIDPELHALAAAIRAARDSRDVVTIGPQPRAARAPTRRLPGRAKEILEMIADGATNQEIADVLPITLDTVKSHVRAVIKELNARNRAHALALAYRAGIIEVNHDEGDQ